MKCMADMSAQVNEANSDLSSVRRQLREAEELLADGFKAGYSNCGNAPCAVQCEQCLRTERDSGRCQFCRRDLL